jgi:hypothetical protein
MNRTDDIVELFTSLARLCFDRLVISLPFSCFLVSPLLLPLATFFQWSLTNSLTQMSLQQSDSVKVKK